MQRQHFVLLLAIPILILSVNMLNLSAHTVHPILQMSITHQPQSQAQQAIDAAQTAINTAYDHLTFADAAGSLIEDLIGTLNGAIVELTAARQAFNQTDYSTAIALATTAETIANTVKDEALLRGTTMLAQIQVQIVLTIVIILISIAVSYFAITRWQQYRKEKRRDFLRMEIRLPDDDEEDEKP